MLRLTPGDAGTARKEKEALRLEREGKRTGRVSMPRAGAIAICIKHCLMQIAIAPALRI